MAEVIVTRTLPLDALLKGMNVLGLGELLPKYPSVVSKIFPSVEDAVVSADIFLHKVTLADGEVKNIELEEQAWKWLQQFVDESENSKGMFPKMAGANATIALPPPNPCSPPTIFVSCFRYYLWEKFCLCRHLR